MPPPSSLRFSEICTLLERLEQIALHEPRILPTEEAQRTRDAVIGWCKSHQNDIDQMEANEIAAVLSSLLPEWRTDRVYNMQAQGLFRMLCRAMNLGVRSDSRRILENYKQPGYGDLGACLERVRKQSGTLAASPVKVVEVDDFLHILARRSNFSDPSIPRLLLGSPEVQDRRLFEIVERLEPYEAKWFARLILKNFSPVRVDEGLVLSNFHFLLPDLLRFQRNFYAVAKLLKTELAEYHPRPDPRSQRLLRRQATQRLRPSIGTKIGRPNFVKARGIDHCLNMLGKQSWVVERKYDGEYSEIHINLTLSPDFEKCIKIFSKSGKDSTEDKSELLPTIIQSLRLGERDCRITKHAILLGEMVVYSDLENEIMSFSTIRKYVKRSGRLLGTEQDSPRHDYEHLAIVYFDILLLDDEIVMKRPVDERRRWLRKSYKKIHGRAMSAEWKIINFDGSESAKDKLVTQFSASIASRCEGLILKPCGIPYASLDMGGESTHRRSYIKLKKDYISGMGDEADFAAIGASYSAQRANTAHIKGLKFTSFHLGCMTNKDDVTKAGARPIFKYVATIDHDPCIPQPVLEAANALAGFYAKPYHRDERSANFDIEPHTSLKMNFILDSPLVFEVLGSSYEKPLDCNFYMLRHPRVKKLHEDRPWEDCITFQELQAQAREACDAPADTESQEILNWIDRLERSCRRKFERQKTMAPMSRTGSEPTTPRTPVSHQSNSKVSASSRLNHTRSKGCFTTFLVHEDTQERQDTPIHDLNLPRKRLSEDAIVSSKPVQQNKKPCLAFSNNSNVVITATASKAPAPLSEISSNAGARSRREMPVLSYRHTRKLTGITRKVCDLFTGSERPLAPSSPACGGKCAFNNAVVVLAPCIAETLYVTEDLLGSHNASITRNMIHWDRDSFAHPPLTEAICESQSDPGMRKIVLVESRRRSAVQDIVERILQLNGGRFKERVEVYDWNVLEHCSKHDMGADALKKHFLGATLFDDTRKRALFVAECDWI